MVVILPGECCAVSNLALTAADDLLTACALNVAAVRVVKRLEYATKQAVSKQGLQK